MAAASGESADPLAVALRAAAVQSVALVLVNAAQHLQRTSILVEAATAAGLTRGLTCGAGPDEASIQALEVSRRAMAEAMETYRRALAEAIDLDETLSSRGRP
jgi:hypothetical protein